MNSTSTNGLAYGLKPLIRFTHKRDGNPGWRKVLIAASSSLFSALYAVLLLLAYRFYVTVDFEYVGYNWDPSAFAIITGLILVAALAAYLPIALRRAGDIILYCLFFIAMVPSLVIPAARSNVEIGLILQSQLVLSICFLFLLVLNQLPNAALHAKLFTPKGFRRLIIALPLLMLIPLVYYLGLPSSVPAFGDVYSRRFDSRDAFTAAPVFIGYFWFWVARVFAPILLVYGLVHRSLGLILAACALTIYTYSLTGSKSVSLALPLVFAVWIALRILGRVTAQAIVLGLISVVGFGAILDAIWGFSRASDLLTRRTLIVPGSLTDQYLQFYSEGEFSRWSHSFLSGFYENPYSSGPSGVVGSFFGKDTTTATAHIWADGFANFGFAGMAFVTLIVGILIWILNSITVGKSAYIVVPLVTMVGYVFANTSLTTAVLTQGVFLTFLVLMLLPQNASREKSSEAPGIQS